MVADETVNCYKAEELGIEAMKKLVGQNFSSIKIKREEKVKPLSAMNKTIVFEGQEVIVNTDQLFSRIVLTKNKDEFADLLKYELAPVPPSLFDEISLRKNQKSALKSLFQNLVPCEKERPKNASFVIDGGLLLHTCPWNKGETYDQICKKYVNYVLRHFNGTAIVVFDGYSRSSLSTKNEEHRRRSYKKSSVDLMIKGHIISTTTQEEFLGNTKNKTQLISLLSDRLNESGITTRQAENDADQLVVTTAVSLAKDFSHVIISSADTDVLVLAIALFNNTNCSLFVEDPPSKKGWKLYNVNNIQEKLGDVQKIILFLHAASGCDTTSALFQKGKVTPFNILKNDKKLRKKVEIFYDPEATHEEIATAGDEFLIKLYNKNFEGSLNELRFFLYSKIAGSKVIRKKKFELSSLPPTEDASHQHFFRTYHQVQLWLERKLPATEWGWKISKGRLLPIPMTLAPAPEELLYVVSCKCKKSCNTRRCSCKKANLKCSNLCVQCTGIPCGNFFEEDIENSEDFMESDIDSENEDFIAIAG